MNQLPLRAETPEQKAEILKRILDCWTNQMPSLRLGQMLLNLVMEDNHLWLIEDETLVKKLEDWANKIKEVEQNK